MTTTSERISALYAAYNAHDAPAAAALYGPNGAHEEIADARVAKGPDAIQAGLEHLFAAFPDVHWEPSEPLIDGRQAVVRYHLTGTLRERLGPFDPVGQRLAMKGVHVFELDAEGRIERSSDYWDGATFRRQMDVSPVAAQPVRQIGAETFRRAMRRLAGGVVVVTTEVDDRPWGLTVSACCSLTAEPPRVMVSLDSRTVSCRAILASGSFGVALLGADQVDVARVCSAPGQPKFIEELVDASRSELRAPVIGGALMHLDCQVEGTHAVGDHRLVVGRISDVVGRPDEAAGEPLVYFERAFRGIGSLVA